MISPLRLHLHIPLKDVRRLIWACLDVWDREMVRCAHNSKRTPQVFCRPFVNHCCVHGYLERLKWAFHNFTSIAAILDAVRGWTANSWFDAASRHNHLPVVEWLLSLVKAEKQHLSLVSVVEGAALGGHLGLVQWCYHKKRCDPGHISYAIAVGGHPGLFKWAWGALPRADFNLERAIFTAVAYDHVQILEMMMEICGHNAIVFTRDHCLSAIRNIRPDTLRWLFEHGAPIEDISYVICAVNSYNQTIASERDQALRIINLIREKNKNG